MGWALNRGRTIERQAASLREALARFASTGEREEVERMIGAMREQLELAERLLDELR